MDFTLPDIQYYVNIKYHDTNFPNGLFLQDVVNFEEKLNDANFFFQNQTIYPTILQDIMFSQFNNNYNEENIHTAKHFVIILYILSNHALAHKSIINDTNTTHQSPHQCAQHNSLYTDISTWLFWFCAIIKVNKVDLLHQNNQIIFNIKINDITCKVNTEFIPYLDNIEDIEDIEDFDIANMFEIYDKNHYISDTSDASDIPDSNNFI